jgi:hypothetical protein
MEGVVEVEVEVVMVIASSERGREREEERWMAARAHYVPVGEADG